MIAAVSFQNGERCSAFDLRVVRALAHDILVMKDGRIVEAGPTERIMTQPEHPYTRALMAAAFDLAPA
jgi:microcin C transport system ATP-binding protein